MELNETNNDNISLITNQQGITLLKNLNYYLLNSLSFIFAVAFITEAGLLMLKTQLATLAKHNVHGKIITSTYLKFNHPKIFTELSKLTNVEVRVLDEVPVHMKVYVFERPNERVVILGSGNLTANALVTTEEWHTVTKLPINNQFNQAIEMRLTQLWHMAKPISTEWIKYYRQDWLPQRQGLLTEDYVKQDCVKQDCVKPNNMQEKALQAIEKLRSNHVKKALVVSATGTGKTYLAAFDVQQAKAKKVLFIAHREQLLQQAKLTFMNVLGNNPADYYIYLGEQRAVPTKAKYIFASIQTLTRHTNDFAREQFDYILIDETHRAIAPSYQLILNYFRPKFLLGLTATPQRTDGFNVYELFDYHLAYEIGLKEALAADMLVPFHYIGVTDYEIDGHLIDDITDLKHLVLDERVTYIIEKATYYGFSGEKLQGLIFVSRQQEGEILADKLSQLGWAAKFLGAKNSAQQRTQAVNDLIKGKLKYLITVDLFNEGIDIPSVNQIIMLRPTQSRIIFLQQLGRGLRKSNNKEYVTVLDFIGNYQQNYLIPQAFLTHNLHDKELLRKQLQQLTLVGTTTINFEEIAAKQILRAVNKTKFDSLKLLQEQFMQLLDRLGRQPMLSDVFNTNVIEIKDIIQKYKTYPEFLRKIKVKNIPIFKDDVQQLLQFISQELVTGTRIHELIILKALILHKNLTEATINKLLENYFMNEQTFLSVMRVLMITDYYTKADLKKYGEKNKIIYKNDTWQFNLEIDEISTYWLLDTINTGIKRIKQQYQSTKQLTYQERYSRKEVIRNLNWQKDLPSLDIGGYKYDKSTHTLPIFITLDKQSEDITTIEYQNQFISQNRLPFFSKPKRTLASTTEAVLFNSATNKVQVEVFVKKSDDEGKYFYYLGQGTVDKSATKETKLLNKRNKQLEPVVRFELILKKEVPADLYHYLIS
ncbi:DUF3427 domain-containing protein [Periweissella beninensis]|uniref:DUF3427 domain-containing protein n=1 Tax=Periweissella beninensis TaxID=504936 RepID=UPI0021A48835|nr:DUF3427 domain-containing protein [Periweissella beninensis]MCT4395810.1 DUF3427 domain-containing protein [Periweissella beninensis]